MFHCSNLLPFFQCISRFTSLIFFDKSILKKGVIGLINYTKVCCNGTSKPPLPSVSSECPQSPNIPDISEPLVPPNPLSAKWSQKTKFLILRWVTKTRIPLPSKPAIKPRNATPTSPTHLTVYPSTTAVSGVPKDNGTGFPHTLNPCPKPVPTSYFSVSNHIPTWPSVFHRT